MTPKEKAKELIKKYTDQEFVCISDFGAKECALITVNEMLNVISSGSNNETFYKEVKIELTNL